MRKNPLSFACPALLLWVSSHAAASGIQIESPIGWPAPAADIAVHTHNVRDFGAVPDDGKDDTAAVQRAIDAAVEAGGGVVYVPAGRYTFRKRLTVRPGITLRGEWKDPEQKDAFKGITVFEIFTGKNEPGGAPFIKMLFAACVRNLTFFYPEQNPESVVPYAYTLDSVFNATIRNATFINSWQAVGHGVQTGSGGNLETQHLYGTPLKTGLFINSGYDFNTVSLIRFNASYWIRFSALGSAQQTALKKHLHEAGDGVVCTYQDGMMMSKIEVDGYRYGLHFRKYNSTAGVPRTASYGQIYELALTHCRQALRADAVLYPGITVQRSVLHGTEHALFNRAHGPLMLSGVNLSSDSGAAIRQTGATSRLALDSCKVRSLSDDAVQIDGGALNMVRCRLASPKKHVRAAASAAGVMLVGNRYTERNADLAIQSPVRKIDPAPLPGPTLELPPLVWPQDRRPESDRVVTARDSAALRQALVSFGPGGGTVFLPAGEYRIATPLVIPPGVELRGVGDGNARPVEPIDGPDRPRVPGTVLMAQMPATESSPLITLSERSGVRGLSIVYPDRNSLQGNPVHPPAIYSASPDSYVMYTDLCNPCLGLVFENADRHLVKFCRTGTDHLGLRVIGGKDGLVWGFAHHSQYWTLNVPADWGMPSYVKESPWHYTINCADGMELLGCRNETIYGFGTWETRNMFRMGGGSDGQEADARMFISSADGAGGMAIRLLAGARRLETFGMHVFRGATSKMKQQQISLQTDRGFDGTAVLTGNLYRNADIRLKGPGAVAMNSSVFFWSPAELTVERGTMTLENAFADISAVTLSRGGRLAAAGVMDRQDAIEGAADADSVGVMAWPDAPWSKQIDERQ